MEYTMADDPKVKAALESIKKQCTPTRKLSPEHIQHMSEALKGRKLSPEHVRHMSEVRKGKKFSEETKRKMSLAKMGNQNRKGVKMKPKISTNEIVYCVEAYGKAIKDGMIGVAEKWAQIAHSFVDDMLNKYKTVPNTLEEFPEENPKKRGRPRKNVETEQPVKKKRHRRTKAEMEAYRESLAAQNQTEIQ